MTSKRSTRGRRVVTQYSDEDRKRLIREQARSGLTKKAFCERNGVNLGTFHGWTKPRTALRKTGFAQVEVATATPAAVEVLLTNGVRIGIRHQGRQVSRGLPGAGYHACHFRCTRG